MIRAVLFDFGGVLALGGKAGSIQSIFAEIYGIDASNVRLDEVHEKLRTGLITTEEFFKVMNERHPGRVAATAALFTSTTDLFKKANAVYDLAYRLQAKGIKTGILSNVYAISADKLRDEKYYDGFDPLILSFEEHLAKPDEAIYKVAIEKTGVPAHDILFIDDQPRCLPPAEKLGMHTILAISPEQIVRDTEALIAKENDLTL